MSESEEPEFSDQEVQDNQDSDKPVYKSKHAYFENSAKDSDEYESDDDEESNDEDDEPLDAASQKLIEAYDEKRKSKIDGVKAAIENLEQRARMNEEAREEGYDSEPADDYSIEDARHRVSSDPFFWTVQVTQGREHNVVMSLLFKAAHEATASRNISICSAFYPPHISGYIIIEAYSLSAVKSAIANIQDIRRDPRTRSPYLMKVPVQEMKNLASVSDEVEESSLKPGSFVRISSGIYRGDLGLVSSYDEDEDLAEVLVVPRLRITVDEDKVVLSSKPKGNNFRARLPQELLTKSKFSSYFRSNASYSGPSTGSYTIGNTTFTDGGLLYYQVKADKVINVSSDVPPTTQELAPFVKNLSSLSEHSTDESLAMVQEATKSIQDAINSVRSVFGVGSIVAYRRGINPPIVGKCIHKTDETTKIQILGGKHGPSKTESVPTSQVVPYFRVGDSILVTAGDYEDVSGIVTHSDPNYTTLTIVPSVTGFGGMQPFTITPNLCILYSGTNAGKDCVNGIYVYDLVSYHADGSSVGMVLRHLKDKAQILTKQNTITVASHDSLQVLPSRRRVVFDAESRPLAVNDSVRIVKSTFAGREAVIKKIWEDVLFLYAENIENNFLALPANSVVNKSSAPNVGQGGENYLMSPAMPSTTGMTPGASGFRYQRTHRTGQRVKLGMVQYKGLVGTIVKANDANVVVRLDIGKIVTISTKQIRTIANTMTIINDEGSNFNTRTSTSSFRKKRMGSRHGSGAINSNNDNNNSWNNKQDYNNNDNNWSNNRQSGNNANWNTADTITEWNSVESYGNTRNDDVEQNWGNEAASVDNWSAAPADTSQNNNDGGWGTSMDDNGWGTADDAF